MFAIRLLPFERVDAQSSVMAEYNAETRGMERNGGRWRFAALAVAVFGGAGTVAAEDITVFAASSLRDAVVEIAEAYESTTRSEVTLVFAASSAIARQVAQGAPADVVLLADELWGQWLLDQGALDLVEPFAANRLVLVSAEDLPVASPGDIASVLGDGLLAMAQTEAVPAGRYGKAALERLGLWNSLQPHVVQSANVRAALRLVERGEARMGVGYVSDLIALPDLYALYEFDAETAPVAVYFGGKITAQGSDFMYFIQGDAGQNVLSDWGFLPPPDAP